MQEMTEHFKIDPSKIVWGLAIGCNDNFADVDLDKTVQTAEYVKTNGMAGVMTWSINRYCTKSYTILAELKDALE